MKARLRSRLLSPAAVTILLLLAAGVLVWVVVSKHETRGRSTTPTGPPVPVVEMLPPNADGLALPKTLGSLRFAVMGDVGRGDQPQYDTAAQMAKWHERFDFSFVLMLGDNMYASGTPADYEARFELPYKPLLDAGVTFYAANGNHDPLNILNYGPYNMHGNRYYTFTKPEGFLGALGQRTVRFFAIDTVNLDPEQLAWIRRELAVSDEDWEICFFHHPLYTSGRYTLHASRIRRALEPTLVQFGADVALAGHEHFYERIHPQRGVLYFTSGAGGALRIGDIRPSPLTAAGFDTDTHFMLMEIADDDLYFQTISRRGETIDSGHMARVPPRERQPLSIGR